MQGYGTKTKCVLLREPGNTGVKCAQPGKEMEESGCCPTIFSKQTATVETEDLVTPMARVSMLVPQRQWA